ncbi:MAG: hypothetical protein Q8O88_04840, partial [bacterium]|nr:hypothetical protein [bacterium]
DAGRIIYRLSSHRLGFGTNNQSDNMVIDSSGNVGIGTIAPAAKLEIQASGSGGGEGILLYDNS